MKIIHKGGGDYWFGKRVVLQTREDFICLQIRLFKKWIVLFYRSLEPPKYAWFDHVLHKMNSLTAQKWREKGIIVGRY